MKATPQAKGILGAFGGVTGIVSALLAILSKLSNKFGEKAGFQWLLIVVAVVFFVLLSIVISWVLVLIGARPWAQQATAWLLGGQQDQIADPSLAGSTLRCRLPHRRHAAFRNRDWFFINANKRVTKDWGKAAELYQKSGRPRKRFSGSC